MKYVLTMTIALLCCTVAYSIPQNAVDSIATDSITKVKDLKELTVTASNVIRRGNMESYIITKDMRKGSRTAGELLRKVNGMHYQPFSEALTYLGSSNVVLLVDSLEKDASYIKRQSPDRFDRIDVVPHPSGKYTGYDVLINFHPKPNYVGFETNVRETMDIMPDGNNGRGNDFSDNKTYIDGTYMQNKLTVTALANWQWSRSGSTYYTKTEYPMSDYSETQLERDRKDPQTINRSNSLSANLAADYKFSDRHKISFQWQISPSARKTANGYVMNVLDKGKEETVGVHTHTDRGNDLLNSFVLNYLGKLGQWNLDVSASYSFNNWKSYYNLERTDNYNLLYDRKDRYDYIWGGFDLNRFFKDYKWYLGFSNYVYVTDFHEKDSFTGDMLSEYTTVYDNLYATAQYIPSRYLSMRANAGITVFSNKTGDMRKTTVVPRLQGVINWNPTEKVSMEVGYTMHTGTPSLSQLNDYGQFINKFKYQEGNPELKPYTAQMINFRISFWRKLTFYAQYEFTSSGIFNIFTDGVMDLDDTGEKFHYASGKYQNGKKRGLILGVNYNQQLSKYFSIYLNAGVDHGYASYQNYRNSVWYPKGSVNLFYELENQDLAASLSYSVNGAGRVTPQVYQKLITDDLLLGVQKGFFKKKLYLALSWYLPLHITKGDWKYRMHSPNMVMNGWGNDQFRTNNKIEITALFRFSTGKQVRKVSLQNQGVNVGSQF